MIAAAGAVFLGLFADLAGRNDYAFEPVKTEIKRGDDVVLAVRLIHKRPRKPIANAMIVVIHVDMAPDGMKEITAPLIALPSSEPGVYAFKTNLPVPGRWLLTIAAKVPGEQQAVVGKVVFRAAR